MRGLLDSNVYFASTWRLVWFLATINCISGEMDTSFQWPRPMPSLATDAVIQTQQTESELYRTWDPKNPYSNSRWRKVIDGLPDSLRLAVLNETTASTSVEDDQLLLLDTNTIAMLKEEMMAVLTGNQVMTIAVNFQNTQRIREAARVLEMLGSHLTQEQIVQLFDNIDYDRRCAKDNQALIRRGLTYLTPASLWTRQIVNNYGLNTVGSLPADIMMRISDSQVATDLLDRLMSSPEGTFGCGIATGTPPENHSAVDINRVRMRLMVSAYGEESGWFIGVIARYLPVMSSLSVESLSNMDPAVLREALPFLSKIQDWSEYQSYAIVRRLAVDNETDLGRMDVQQLADFIDELNGLGPYLLPEYLSSDELVATWAAKMKSLSRRGVALPRRTASALLHYSIGQRNVNDFDETDLLQLDANYLKVAPRKLWRLSVELDVIDKALFQRLALDPSSGHVLDGDIRRISGAARRKFGISAGNQVDTSGFPSIYLTGITPSEIAVLSVQQIKILLPRLILVADQMNTAQLASIYIKLKEHSEDLSGVDVGPVIKSIIPLMEWNDYPLERLQSFAADMPPDSTLRLLYAERYFSKKMNKLSATDLMEDPLLVATLQPDHIEDVALPEVPSLMKIISSVSPGPSIQAVRALHQRLRQHTKSGRIDIADNDISLIEHTWLTDMDIYPATVLAQYSTAALQSASAEMQVELLRSLGRLSVIDYYIVAKNKRSVIVETALSSLNDPLGDEDVIWIGNAVLDFQPQHLQRLSFRAFQSALPILQGDVEIFPGLTARPCLTSEQRLAIRGLIASFYGDASTWGVETLGRLCCSLDTLSEQQLDAIRDDVILECSCGVGSIAPLPWRPTQQFLQGACRFELGADLGGLAEGTRAVSARKSSAAMSIHRADYTFVPGINNQPEGENENVSLTCDAVIAAGSASSFTADQLQSLRDEDILDCLYELGANYLTIQQATTVWNRIKQVYGDLYRIPRDQLLHLGWILRGLDSESIGQLRPDDPDLVAALGSTDFHLDPHKMAALVKKVETSGRKGPDMYTGLDMMSLGHLICGFNESTARKMRISSFMTASAALGYLVNCSADALEHFARMAVKIQVFGAPRTWRSATIRNLGIVIGGLSADQVRKLAPSSLQALTINAISSLSPNQFRAFKTDQILNFPLGVVQAVTQEQSVGIVEEMVQALQHVVWGDEVYSTSKSNQLSSSRVAMAVATLALIWFL